MGYFQDFGSYFISKTKYASQVLNEIKLIFDQKWFFSPVFEFAEFVLFLKIRCLVLNLCQFWWLIQKFLAFSSVIFRIILPQDFSFVETSKSFKFEIHITISRATKTTLFKVMILRTGRLSNLVVLEAAIKIGLWYWFFLPEIWDFFYLKKFTNIYIGFSKYFLIVFCLCINNMLSLSLSIAHIWLEMHKRIIYSLWKKYCA
jgi:hypothetical protein